MAHSVRSLGPLWAHSAFVFESVNGNIVRQVSAAKGLPHQITKRVGMFQQLHQLVNSPRLPLGHRMFCKEFFGYGHVQKALRVNDGLYILGVGKPTALRREDQSSVEGYCGATVARALQYERFVQARQVFRRLHTESQESQIQLLCGRATGSTSALKKSYVFTEITSSSSVELL